MNARPPLVGAVIVAALAVLVSNPALALTAGSRTASVLYVADNVNNAVLLFNAQNLDAPMLGSITNGVAQPSSIALDKMGNLYVANAATGTITVYRSGASSPSRTIPASKLGLPAALAVDRGDSLVVGYDGAGGKSATLAIFDKRSARPTRTISIPAENNTISIGAIAAEADALYVSVARSPSGPSQLLRFARGSSHGVDIGISPGTGEAFDAQGNFYVGSGSSVSVYSPGSRQARYIVQDLFDAGQIATAPDGTLFVPDGQDRICSQFTEPGYVTVYSPGSAHASFYLQSSNIQNPVSLALLSVK